MTSRVLTRRFDNEKFASWQGKQMKGQQLDKFVIEANFRKGLASPRFRAREYEIYKIEQKKNLEHF